MGAAAFEDGRAEERRPGRPETLRVLVVDENRLLAEALCVALELHDRIETCRCADGVDEGVAEMEAVVADVVVLDADLRHPGAVTGARLIRQRWPATRILMLSADPDVDLLAD